ncbi:MULTISPECIES: DUF2612 domain-containing protein [Clostridium]|uniref:DUF2612 domain-containing protein n=1 Tax=Clostridium TaxID=1485 RepID=UPI000E00DB7A|nr:DUF2612 domain-containing protein [Clostridium sporogenes]MCW6085505.1 DUF2612 domain-containing protein [Clostridium sporogenes]STC83949.1 Protein of uncharacterised function (DUF2612) [Clostridium botulinum]
MAIEKYVDNITSQHRDKPKFISWLSSSLTILDHAYLAIKSIDINFDLDDAIGKQLDTLGTIIGRERVLTFQPLNGHDPVLDDETYRLVLKAKVAMNMWDGTIPQMYEIWDNIFKDIGLELQDNQDMSFNAYITGYVNQIRQDLIQHGYIVPKPEGVKVNYIGKSLIDFKPYSGMLVSTRKSETINMSYNPKEVIGFKQHQYFIVQGLNKITIKMKGVEEGGII